MKPTERGDFAADPRVIPVSLIALAIGGLASAAAVFLLNMIRLFTNLFFFGHFSFAFRSPAEHALGAWVIVVPVAGALLIGLMARYGTEKIRGHGIPEAIEAILYGKSLMQPKVAILKPLSSGISIGSGGPFGAEGPIIMTGGAVGSILAQFFHLSAAERKALLVAGAAAGMTAVFGTPIAAVLLSVELLLFELRPRSLVPVALACATAAALRPFLLGSGPLFPIPGHAALGPVGLSAAVGVGVIAGALATAMSKTLYKLEDGFARLPIHWMWWPALGGLVVGIGGYINPRVLGVGYDVIGDLLQAHIAAGPALTLVTIKAIVWLFALASGTSGGVLAPLLIVGAGVGMVEGSFLPDGTASLWALVSMAAVLGGMMRSPLMASMFALELTNDIQALPPLLIACVTAYAFTVLVMKRSILTEKTARRGYDIFREYGVDPLERLRVGEIMTRKVISIPADMAHDELVRQFFTTRSHHRGYPVLSKGGGLAGVLTASDLLKAEQEENLAKRTALDLATRDVAVAYTTESCRVAAERMAVHGIGRLPVLSRKDPTQVVGIVTRSDLLKARLRIYEEEAPRERPISFPKSLRIFGRLGAAGGSRQDV